MKFIAKIVLALTLALNLIPAGGQAHDIHKPAISSEYNIRIIDDAVFTNESTMSATAIQSFLDAKVPVCQSGYKCLKDYEQGGKSAARIIYDWAKKFGVNPQVILVTLQKEQSLVTDDFPVSAQYRTAMGYGCPESESTCNSEYYGFTNQVKLGTKLLRVGVDRNCGNMDSYPGWSVNPSWRVENTTTVDGKSTKIGTCATGSLYNYTPHRPDSAYKQASNGSHYYGNYNFIDFFTDWFGSTYYGQESTFAGDFDGDGRSDVFWYRPGGTSDQIRFGTATKGEFDKVDVDVTGDHKPVVGDFDGDGYDDILWYRPGGTSDPMWFGSATRGTFNTTSTSITGTYQPLSGDFDSDGFADILLYRPGGTSDPVWSGTATRGQFSRSSTSVTGDHKPVVGDFDGDSHADILWYRPGGTSDPMWFGTNTRSEFSRASTSITGSYKLVVGDFNGGGRSDIILYRRGGTSDPVWSGTATKGQFSHSSTSVTGNYKPVVGDFNGGGRSDILWYLYGHYTLTLWSGTATPGQFDATSTN